jgi:hypothetical protein
MYFKMLFSVILFFQIGVIKLYAQKELYSKITISKNINSNFSFTKKWDYAWDVFKDENTGIVEKLDGDSTLTAEDTTHLYFTANCKTNIQGGYTIRYCYATKENDFIKIDFSDGLPAYASHFSVYLKKDSFYCVPKTIYPQFTIGQKISYTITKQQLRLIKKSFSINEKIQGFINLEFIETVEIPSKTSVKNKFFLRGYFKAPLQVNL